MHELPIKHDKIILIIFNWYFNRNFYFDTILIEPEQTSHSRAVSSQCGYLVFSCLIVANESVNMWNIFTIKPTSCTIFSNLFRNETLPVSDSSPVHHYEFFHCTHSNGICRIGLYTAFKQDQYVPSCSKAVYKPVWHIPLLTVQWKTPDDGQRNCPKHGEFHSEINLRI
jgi:hypothetical protein